MTVLVSPRPAGIRREHVEIYDDEPNIAAAVRAIDGRLIWCNRVFARELGATPEVLIGTTSTGTTPEHIVKYGRGLMQRVVTDGKPLRFYQLWMGRRALVTVRAIDPESFGTAGWFVTARQDNHPTEPGAEAPITAPVATFGEFAALTRRELEILYFIGLGLPNKHIAGELFRATKTVANQISEIHRKLNVRSRSEITRLTAERGLTAFSREEWSMITSAASRESDAPDSADAPASTHDHAANA